jgi:hypothetical protein
LRMPVLADSSISRLIVTGHPNHELAIFGFVQRLRPRLVFLTDGGGEERVNETRRALDTLGLLDNARFLGWTEKSLYQALLDQDLAVFVQLVEQVRAEILACAPRQILCESIELYNPLHDITLPIVRAATRGLDGIEIVEFPLIAQVAEPGERYRIQRLPESRKAAILRLSDAEVAVKQKAREQHYLSLRQQLGGVLDEVDREHLAEEHFAPALEEMPTPGQQHLLRYEWRAQDLKNRGEIDRMITYRDHFLPVVAAL